MNAEQLTEKLVRLGSRWSTVAMNLHRHNIKGFRRNSCECPIANYVKQITGAEYVSVDHRSIAVGTDPDDIAFAVETPEGVADFLAIFDGSPKSLRFLADRRDVVRA